MRFFSDALRHPLVESATFVLFEFAEPTIKKLVDKFAEEADEQTVRSYLTNFERFKQSLQLKDPFQYKTFQELEQAVDAAKGKSEFKKKKTVDTTTGHEAEAIADDADVQIFKGDEQHKCVKYGQGYSFCISRAAGGNMFNNYRLGKASTFYFVFFKKVPKTDHRHIMVLDRTRDGWEWTFGENHTQRTTWEKVEQSFPVLKKYQHLFVNKELDDEEKDTLAAVHNFHRKANKVKFSDHPYKTQTAIVRSGVSLTDVVFDQLDKAQRNEYFSTGVNITEHQISAMTPGEKSRYNAVRKTVWKQLDEEGLFIPNSLDFEADWFYDEFNGQAEKITERQLSLERVKGNPTKLSIDGNYNGELYYLPESLRSKNSILDVTLTDHPHLASIENIPRNCETIYIENLGISSLNGLPEKVNHLALNGLLKLKTLEGCSKFVSTKFIITNLGIQNLEGGPEKVGDSIDIRACQNLMSLKGAPREITNLRISKAPQLEDFTGMPDKIKGDLVLRGDIGISTFYGAPSVIGGDLCFVYTDFNNLESLEGFPKKIGGNIIVKGTIDDNFLSLIPDDGKHEYIRGMILNQTRYED